ncbi:hypothetical protein QNH98_04730 [Myroides sp. mNGS23_01]|nr:hypothetical protein [Myroides sp. mNGS23_01]WHT39966.1 hypothetical protein QNH98_04730 [Myroides sp. mNGS23_01]
MSKKIGIQIQGDQEHPAFMDIQVEVQRDAQGLIVQGMVVDDIVEQNKSLILITHPGEWKANPTLGVGLSNMLLDHDYLAWRHRIREQFAQDELVVYRLDLFPNKPFVIDANYKN